MKTSVKRVWVDLSRHLRDVSCAAVPQPAIRSTAAPRDRRPGANAAGVYDDAKKRGYGGWLGLWACIASCASPPSLRAGVAKGVRYT